MTPPIPTYTLDSIIADGYTMVIPDLQRDYCWGSDNVSEQQPREKVSGFVTGLLHLHATGRPVPMGLVYGYTEVSDTRRIHVIDGQQRLTTLYLLCGMLYRRCRSERLMRLLVNDAGVPRLIYQVRDEAQWFLADLVTHFFLGRDGRLSQLEGSAWYYASYDSDPSVRGFIGAIRNIDNVLEHADADAGGFDFEAFADFIMGSLTLMYHDLGSQTAAESMFITVNTTSQPLSLSQNVRILLHDDDDEAIDAWDTMERWCLEHRQALGAPVGTDPMDRLLDIYIRWCRHTHADSEKATQIDTYDMLRHIDVDSLYRLFTAFSRLVFLGLALPSEKDTDPETQNFLILPAIAYLIRWGDTAKDSEVESICRWLVNISRVQRPTASGSDTVVAIRIVRRMPDPDIVSLLEMRHVPSRLLNEDLRVKLSLIKAAMDTDDPEIPHIRVRWMISRAEDHPVVVGCVSRLIEWCTDRHTYRTDIARLGAYIDALYEIWGHDPDCRTDLDLLRRALLTIRHPGYPIIRRGDTSLTLCWHTYDWQRLMQKSPGAIRHILDRVVAAGVPATATFEAMIRRFDDRTYPWYFLIKNQEIMRGCGRRALMCPGDVFVGMHLCDTPGLYRTGGSKWWIEQLEMKPMPGWSTVRAYGSRCLYTDHRHSDAAIDIYYTPGQRAPYRVEIFNRPDSDRPAIDLDPLVEAADVPLRYDRKRHRWHTPCIDARNALAMARTLANLLKNS